MNKNMNNEQRKCHMCKGKGMVTSENRKGQCYYCRGKGIRTQSYGRDEQ